MTTTDQPMTQFTNSRGDTFTVGEWVVADYDIHQIVEIRDYGHHIGVDRSTGYIHCGGWADDCWKLTLTTKVIADGVQGYHDKLKTLPGEHGFNWPDLHHKLVEFAEIGYALDREMPERRSDYAYNDKRNEAFSERLWEPLEAWFQEVKDIATAATSRTAGGVRVIGR